MSQSSIPSSASSPPPDGGAPAWPGTSPPGTGLGEESFSDLVRGICFKTGPPRTVGVELEWLVHDAADPLREVSADRLRAAHTVLKDLPLNSLFTVEPGGQLELSSAPAPSLAVCVEQVSADMVVLRGALAALGLRVTGLGTEPSLPGERLLREPRYDAMERYLDRAGPAGRHMMRSSASVQVCLDAGYEEPGPQGHHRRWHLAHLLGPVLVAAFANSPVHEGRLTGWRSTRQSLWAEIEPGRSAAPPLDAEPRAAWTERVLDAPVMCVRAEEGPWDAPEGLTFRDWVRGKGPRPVTEEDLAYHLTTLFPPVRPRGHLELRMIDAQPGEDGWRVPLAVTCALFDDAEATETAYRIVKPLAERATGGPAPHNALWEKAARSGLADPELREAATACFATALQALPRLGADEELTAQVAAFTERYPRAGRCPADDFLDTCLDIRPGRGPAEGPAAHGTVRGEDAPA
ncbi:MULTISPECIES: ergothioneine biosynthesis glutamate--cysteine ligase EgtA [Streptomyces]|uniref:ergothioneine biosynthesis glutamate--cysteine ligase EgtA n=1 Tax=Streptomyces TaxID=1883 RepID=UPI001436B283|nr:ergothioneine biosynthesis glutamate--cysteine ligase EgtA [Streptomyces sp. S-2]MBV7252919.1 ergothioneine biosynthesis glutamate--cysteine ligase EgtA [Streptomyces sp. S-2]WSD38467.1 ergothioneine biosynthesis glutamate--cysteine ligase EgtA [Streptomyces albidoflavus]WTB66590.1 ergothioneine biosynthesis glutamate--cysteine ligase EgtA [Streptomyces albidoflavus]WTB74035.1 ergothioneine biosynthesis glutamate--cysteine ligase EgtA [Streptomyces albidoflavus]